MGFILGSPILGNYHIPEILSCTTFGRRVEGEGLQNQVQVLGAGVWGDVIIY